MIVFDCIYSHFANRYIKAMNLNTVSTSQVESLLLLENDLILAARPHRLQMKRTPDFRKRDLLGLSAGKFSAMEENMASLLDVLTVCSTEQIDPWDDREFFRLSMRSLRLSYPSDCTQNFVSGDLVEIYDLNRLQVFRNMQFMEYSNYSLIEILSIEWPKLFDRAAAITERMIQFCDQTLWAKNQTIPFNIPPHYMRELQTDQRQTYEIRFRYISPIFSGPNQPFGILGTCACRLISAPTKDNVSFI